MHLRPARTEVHVSMNLMATDVNVVQITRVATVQNVAISLID